MTPPAISDSYSDGAAEPPIWSPPDPALAAAGIEGEFVVARVRLLAMAPPPHRPHLQRHSRPGKPMFVTGFAVTVVGGIAAVAIWSAPSAGVAGVPGSGSPRARSMSPS